MPVSLFRKIHNAFIRTLGQTLNLKTSVEAFQQIDCCFERCEQTTDVK